MQPPDRLVDVIDGCRSCGSSRVVPFLSLGSTPLADGLVSPSQVAEQEELRFPLEVGFCAECSLVQLFHTVAPELLFCRDYPYYSSFSDTVLEHSRRNALRLLEQERLVPDDLVVELASNDGYLLRNFVERGVSVLGIDPAPGPAEAARRIGVETLTEFFDDPLAHRLRAQGIAARVIVANNVLAHVADLNDFVAGLRTLLTDDGVGSIEVPYVRDLIEQREFDTIYHEHLCYFSVTALVGLFRRHDLELTAVDRLPIHGGSLRLTIRPRGAEVDASVTRLMGEERSAGLDRIAYYSAFAAEVEEIRRRLRGVLDEVRSAGGRIAAYGAAAKGATLLNYASIGGSIVDFVVDRNPHKHGKLMPGVHLPIRPTEALVTEQPTHVLLLAWNFRDEILEQQREYRDAGGRFIVPIPEPAIL
jgi:SAM-dependent methyltransferase